MTHPRSGLRFAIGPMLACAALVACGSSGGKGAKATVASTTSSPTSTSGATSTTGSTITSGPSSTGATTTTSAATSPASFPYQPLYPFTDAADAAAWQASYRQGGHQPWHLSASNTALSFTDGYLGYSDVDRVVSTVVSGNQARVGVGYALEGGRLNTAAVIHLARLGQGPDAPWEVVGTDDAPTFTVTAPVYGVTVASPVTVGGRISGVDEQIVVVLHQLGSTAPIGKSPGVPAGGQATPWHVSVRFTARTGGVVTVAASTGGHVKGVERFAVTGIQPPS